MAQVFRASPQATREALMDKSTPTEELTQQPTTDPLGTPPVIESTIAASEVTNTEPPAEPDISKHPTVPLQPLTPAKRYFQVNWWSVVAIALSLVLVGEHTAPYLLSLVDGYLHPKATVTLFPTQTQMSKTYTFLAVTGTADQARGQIPSRLLSFTTPTKSATITTTGVGYTPAIKATGEITFYNEAPYSQTIDAGTVITGNDRIQIVTDQTVTIAAGNGTTNGSATAPVHTIQAGVRANIPPFAINTLCCVSGILARNLTAFTGGQDPQPYQIVSQTDVKREAGSLAISLDAPAHQGIQEQVKPTEQLIQPVQCSRTTTSNPQVGERAITASVSVFQTCNAQVYDYSLMQSLTQSAFLADAQKQAGSNFIQRGTLTLAIDKTTLLDKSHQTYQLTVSAAGTLFFHLTGSQLQRLKMQIAGETITEAKRQLLTLAGVQGVYIQPARQSDLSLPTNPDQIQMIVSSLPG